MKKFLIATGIAVVALSGCAYSQEGAQSLASANVHAYKLENQYLNDINVKAMRDFVGRYGDMPEVVWHKANNSYIAVFFKDSIQHRVIYTGRGDLSYIMRYYSEKHLPRSVRSVVKSTYYDYSIYIVQELEMPDRPTVYIVNLQGSADWKKVRVMQGEMEVMEEFSNAK